LHSTSHQFKLTGVRSIVDAGLLSFLKRESLEQGGQSFARKASESLSNDR